MSCRWLRHHLRALRKATGPNANPELQRTRAMRNAKQHAKNIATFMPREVYEFSALPFGSLHPNDWYPVNLDECKSICLVDRDVITCF